MTLDGVRYTLTAFLLVAFPAGMSMWFVIHPLAAFWRRRAPAVTYSVVIGVAISVALVLEQFRKSLLVVEFGFRWPLALAGLVLFLVAVFIEQACRRQLGAPTLLGLPEVSSHRASRLVNEGIYSRIRHPRYVGIWLEIAAVALFTNYLAAYLVVLLMIPVLYVIVVLEERELLVRLGQEYAEYMRHVPRFIPK